MRRLLGDVRDDGSSGSGSGSGGGGGSGSSGVVGDLVSDAHGGDVVLEADGVGEGRVVDRALGLEAAEHGGGLEETRVGSRSRKRRRRWWWF